jgi:hypothetical protein
MLMGCDYWESTVTNCDHEIVGYRRIKLLSSDFFEVSILTSEGRFWAQEYCRKVTKKNLENSGGIEQLKKLFVTLDQALLSGDISPQVSASGIILETQKSIDFHIEQAKKAKGF